MTRHAGVVGSPIAHSLSPVLHRAAYAALGLEQWFFHRDQVESGMLERYLASRSAQWAGLSITMPLKEEALAAADESSQEADLVGAANTLTRSSRGWRADNTDIFGLGEALREAGLSTARSAVIVGSGATARSALVALSRFGVSEVRFLVRGTVRPAAPELAKLLGMVPSVGNYAAGPSTWGAPDVVVSTVPGGATPLVDGWRLPTEAIVFDVVYAGWPTEWALQWAAQGCPVVRGDRMLLHQAARQVRLMTGFEAPIAPMANALDAALGARG